MSGGEAVDLARQVSLTAQHPNMRKICSQNLLLLGVLLIPLQFLPLITRAELPLAQAAANGRAFLTNLLDRQLDLLPEFQGAKTFWLYHDNYLAAKVLGETNPKISAKIMAAIRRESAGQDSKAKILFNESEQSLPFRQYQLTDVRRLTNGMIRTEIITTNAMTDWTNYADLLFLACIAETNAARAHADWNAAMILWDGHGFMDAAARAQKQYATYKLGLAAVAARHLRLESKLPPNLLKQLLSLQSSTGGWITDYDGTGEKIGVPNVETTCLCILGIEAMAGVR